MRFVVTALILAAALAPALAQAAPSPAPSGIMEQKVPLTFKNPGAPKGQSSMSGQGCIASHANASLTEINPVTGKPQAAPIVSIPLTGGNVATATNRAQQHHACAHART
jgi:hypothetical protein